MMGIGYEELGRWTMDMKGVRKLELFIGRREVHWG